MLVQGHLESSESDLSRAENIGYHGTSEIEHGLWDYTVDNPFAKAQGLSLHTGPHTMLYLSLGMLQI